LGGEKETLKYVIINSLRVLFWSVCDFKVKLITYVCIMNKTIVITGGTRGIGRAIAEKFTKGGFNVAICARSENDLLAMDSELTKLRAHESQSILTAKCDISKRDELKAFAGDVLHAFGHVDVLVNNGGVFLPGQIHNEEEGLLEKLIETNLYSAYHLSRLLLPGMIKKNSGHIFNMCSVASIKAYPNGGSYSISKFAMLGLSKALREELKEFNIKVTALLPGATLTDSWKGTNLPESRFMKAEDVANLVWDIHHLSENTVVEEVVLRPVLGDI
jgi:short-subunit dehydrogenase